MSKWNVKPSTLIILGCVAFLMVLILVLPDVDLPDFTFHRGTAPVVVHAQATAAPAAATVAVVFRIFDSKAASRPPADSRALGGTPEPNFRPILLRSIRC